MINSTHDSEASLFYPFYPPKRKIRRKLIFIWEKCLKPKYKAHSALKYSQEKHSPPSLFSSSQVRRQATVKLLDRLPKGELLTRLWTAEVTRLSEQLTDKASEAADWTHLQALLEAILGLAGNFKRRYLSSLDCSAMVEEVKELGDIR